MRVEVNNHTLKEIAEQYESAVSWVASIGFPVDRGRLDAYRRIVAELSANFETHGWGDFDSAEHRERVCRTLLEIRELISIHRGLAPLPEPDSATGLRHCVKGPFSPTSELASTASNRARNTGFELYLNALFAFGGLRPRYSTDADLLADYRGHTVFVEAKRPASAGGVERAIHDANRQLSRRLDHLDGQDAMGLLALDLTKVINPDSKVMPVSDEEHLRALMWNEDTRQIAMLRSYWHKRRHPRTAGVMLHYRLLTNFVPAGTLNTLKWVGFVQFVQEPMLSCIHEALEEAIQHVC